MKKLLAALVFVAAALVAYNFVSTGEVKLIPGSSMSELETRLADLEKEVATARKQLAQAGRSAGLAGIDSTADVAAARRSVEGTHKALQKLKPRLASDAEKERARSVESAIEQFRRDVS